MAELRREAVVIIAVKEFNLSGGWLFKWHWFQFPTAEARWALLELVKLSCKLRQILPRETCEERWWWRVSRVVRRGRSEESVLLRIIRLRACEVRRGWEGSRIESRSRNSRVGLLSLGFIGMLIVLVTKSDFKPSGGHVDLLRVRVDDRSEGGARGRRRSSDGVAWNSISWSGFFDDRV